MILIAGHAVSTCYETLMLHPKKLDTIVLLDPGTKIPSFVSELARSYICFEFYDIVHDPRPIALSPQRHHVEDVLKWAENKEDILVACHMGISRSSALALLIAVTRVGLEKSFEILSPHHFPNRLILKIGSEILKLPIYESCLEKIK